MLLLFALCVAFGPLDAAITHFTWRDCDADPNRPVQFKEITVHPVPVVNPGKLHLHAKAEITRPISKFQLKLDITRHTFLSNIHIPCQEIEGSKQGSCTHDGCTVMSEMLSASSTAEQDVARQIQKLFHDHSFTYTCPVPAQTLDIREATINLPSMGSLAGLMADGDYTIEVRFLNQDSGELYGCLTFDVALKHQCVGWTCGR